MSLMGLQKRFVITFNNVLQFWLNIMYLVLQCESFAPLWIEGLVDGVRLKLAVTQLGHTKGVAFL